MRAFLWRFLDADDDKVAAGCLWNDVRSRKMAFLPAVRFFRQFSIRIVNMNGNLGPIDFGPQPKPIFVPFEQLLPDAFFSPDSEVASPVILTHLKSLFHIRFCCLKSERLRIVHRGAGRTLHATMKADQQELPRKRTFAKRFIEDFLIFRDDARAEPRRDLIDFLN